MKHQHRQGAEKDRRSGRPCTSMSHRPEAERESTHERQGPLPEVVSERLEAELEVEEARKNEDDDRRGSSCTSEFIGEA